MTNDELFKLANELETVVDKSTPTMSYEYLTKTDNCNVLIAKWWDEMRPILVIKTTSDKMLDILGGLTIGKVIGKKSHGDYYIAGFDRFHIEAFSIIGDEDVIRFLLACFGKLDKFHRKNIRACPVIEL